MICYVTAFLDINRDKWENFSRSFDKYLESFIPYIDLFNIKLEDIKLEDILVVYIDKKYLDIIVNLTKDISNIIVIPIDEEFLEINSVLWQRLEQETEIVTSEKYKTQFNHRLQFPENNNAKYSLINHAKIDFVVYTINNIETIVKDKDIKDVEYFCWSDFGYFSNKNNIPKQLLDINKLDINRINYTLINEVHSYDIDIMNTMNNPREVIGGFFWFGRKDKILEYQKLYHQTHKEFQYMWLVDDDQHIALRCYFKNPNLFALHHLGKWHCALIHFQKE